MLGSSFQEPASPDQTSTPPENTSPIAQALTQASKKKKKSFGSNVKNPGALKAAIARSRRARQIGDKWGA